MIIYGFVFVSDHQILLFRRICNLPELSMSICNASIVVTLEERGIRTTDTGYFNSFSLIIANISAGVTTKSTFGKCFMLPVTKYESSLDNATS